MYSGNKNLYATGRFACDILKKETQLSTVFAKHCPDELIL